MSRVSSCITSTSLRLKLRSRIADVGWPTVTAHLILSATEFWDLADEYFWALKCLSRGARDWRTFKSVACSGNFEHRGRHVDVKRRARHTIAKGISEHGC